MESALKSTKASDLSFALAAVLSLSEHKHITVDQKTIEDAFKKLVSVQDDDGQFAGSVLTTGLALQALAKYAKVNTFELNNLFWINFSSNLIFNKGCQARR